MDDDTVVGRIKTTDKEHRLVHASDLNEATRDLIEKGERYAFAHPILEEMHHELAEHKQRHDRLKAAADALLEAAEKDLLDGSCKSCFTKAAANYREVVA